MAETIVFEPLQRRYVIARTAITAALTLVVAVAATATVLVVAPETWRQGLIAVVLLPGMPLLTYLSCNRRGYALRKHDIALRKGVFWQRQVIQPFVRIQHIELARGPIEKRLELAGLRIFSAGTGAETMTIPGLNLATAQRIRSHLLDAQNT